MYVCMREASSNWRDFTLRQIQILKTPNRWPYGDKLVFAICFSHFCNIYCSFTPCAYLTIILLAIKIEIRFRNEKKSVENLRYFGHFENEKLFFNWCGMCKYIFYLSECYFCCRIFFSFNFIVYLQLI